MITKGKMVTLDYILKNDKNEVLDQSTTDDPLIYLHGYDELLPPIVEALENKTVKEQVVITVKPKDGYGEYRDELIQEIPKEEFGDESIEKGQQFSANIEGQVRTITIKEIKEKAVTVDANHPFAGQTLTFDLTIRDIKDATEEEINMRSHSGCSNCSCDSDSGCC